ncbi:MAG: VCBS repeat-containing protein [Planctomycetota bacterium]|nr:MAG: VCBS repeat-containing protein [Planctomycetota bacterium]
MAPLLPLLLAAVPQAAETGSSPVLLEPEPAHLALPDLDRDGRADLLDIARGEIHWPDGPPTSQRVRLPGEATFWTVADGDGDGFDDLLALVDGESLQVLRPGPDELVWETLLDGLGAGGRQPRGYRPARILRDIDGDGRPDLLVPAGERVRLWFGTEAGGFRAGPELRLGGALRLELGRAGRRSDLLGRVGRTLSVPSLRMRDISGDRRPDLVVQDGQKIFQYVAGPTGLPLEPTTEVDLARFEARLPALRFDPGNIAGLSRQSVWEHWADLNLDGAEDMVVLAGGTVVVYLGGDDGLDLRRPRDQLPTAGNVLYAFTARVDEDDLPDLVLLRIEDVSLARALTWVVFRFSVEIDLLAYEGLGNGRFGKRPMPQSRTLKVESPSLLDLFRGRDAADELRRTVVRLADFDGDGRRTDLVVLDPEGRLRCWRDRVPDRRALDEAGSAFLRDLLRRRRTLDLDADTLVRWLLGRASLLVETAEQTPPDFVRPAPPDWRLPQAMAARDFDGDGRDELLVLHRRKGEGREARRALVGFFCDPDAEGLLK